MDEMNEWKNKKCKIWIKNLSDKAIIYTGVCTAVSENFLTILDRNNDKVSVNITDIIQIREEKDEM